jgi:hypothetical protein
VCVSSQTSDPKSLHDFKTAIERRHSSVCADCPSECATCSNGRAELQSGWRLSGQTVEELELQLAKARDGHALVAFRCPSATLKRSACPATLLSPPASTLPTNESITCASNHTGRLCAVCAKGFYSKDDSCRLCSANAPSHEFLAIGCIGGLVVLLVYQKHRLEQSRIVQRIILIHDEIKICIKIMLGMAQVLALIRSVLDIVFPPNPTVALSYTTFATLDIRAMLGINCMSWYHEWLLSVVVLPCGVGIVVAIRYIWQKTTTSRAEARASAVRALFFAVMLIHPRVSTDILSALRCRQLGKNVSVLQIDYSISCNWSDNSAYAFMNILASLMVVTWIIGIPLGILFTLLSNHQSSADHVSTHNPIARSAYEFCAGDYRNDRFWFEPVDMIRKLALSGLLQFVDRGSAVQVLVGCGIAFCSFGMQMLLLPYREPEANVIKAVVDCQIFLTFLVSFVIRVYPAIESYDQFSVEFYGDLLIGTIAIAIVCSIGLTVAMVRRHREFSARLSNNLSLDLMSSVQLRQADTDSQSDSDTLSESGFTVPSVRDDDHLTDSRP